MFIYIWGESMCIVVGCNMRDCICKSIFIAENCNNVIKCGKYIYKCAYAVNSIYSPMRIMRVIEWGQKHK